MHVPASFASAPALTDPASGGSSFELPFVFTADGNKSLYFTLDQLQSRMCCDRPTHLDVDYTRTMMGFLMFNRSPANIAMIGLGGGSLLKFCYRHLPGTHFTAVEINPHVLALRTEFEVPDDKERIAFICADGSDFIQEKVSRGLTRYDVLMVDGFDCQGQAPSLCSQHFYDDCFQVLSPQGILVANLHHDHAEHAIFRDRIRNAFNGNLMEIASAEKSNSILFACKGAPISVDALRENDNLAYFDQEARDQLQAEFSRISWLMN